MRLSLALSLLLSILFLSLTPTFATEKSYIVYLGGHSHGPSPSSADLDRVTTSHYSLLGSLLGSSNERARHKIFYSYTNHINGFAALLEEDEAAEIAKNPNVVSVFENRGRKLQTTHSWDFLGLERNGVVLEGSIWKRARFGEGTIIGNLDTGVWPESKSFSDEGLGPVPSKWRGICQLRRDTKHQSRCNRKLIGARYFNKGYASVAGRLNSSFNTARDSDGHGTHTLSTAGGSLVPGASVFGNGNGTAKGGSPRARVAAYKVCWPPVMGNECFDADILAAFDSAISDGVDVLSVSLGGDPAEFFNDGISVGAFHAAKKGILVVASAGNSGPTPGSVSNVAPWMLTVGASTMDREFTSYVQLGNHKTPLKGASLSARTLPSGKFYPLVNAVDAKAPFASAAEAQFCKPGTLDAGKVWGKILVCLRGDNPRVDKGEQAVLAGAVAMILVNDAHSGSEIIADAHLLPASHINSTDGEALFRYITSTKSPVASISRVRTELGKERAPSMASFSSRGPNIVEEGLLKPDITAPGVSIIAAYGGAIGPTGQDYDKRRVLFNVESGTSMSSPHVAGIAGLLKTIHPDWSPAAISSAIITTAKTRDNDKKPMLDSSSGAKATPFAYGAGQVQPNRAMDPGLVYNLTNHDYLNFLCARGYNQSLITIFAQAPYQCPKSSILEDFNYPSITVRTLPSTVTRTVTNVGPPGTYNVRVREPTGVSVSVSPASLKFTRTGESKKFMVRMKSKVVGRPLIYTFGQLIWSDGKHNVRSPLVARA